MHKSSSHKIIEMNHIFASMNTTQCPSSEYLSLSEFCFLTSGPFLRSVWNRAFHSVKVLSNATHRSIEFRCCKCVMGLPSFINASLFPFILWIRSFRSENLFRSHLIDRNRGEKCFFFFCWLPLAVLIDWSRMDDRGWGRRCEHDLNSYNNNNNRDHHQHYYFACC